MAQQAHKTTSCSCGDPSIGLGDDIPNFWDRPEVLLVEDGTGVFEEIGGILQEQGFQVLLAPDATTALEEMGNYLLDVVMVGATRRDLSGLQVLDQAKCQNPEVVTIVLTRGYGVDLPVEAYEADIDCYLGWPVLPGDLGRRLMNLLAADILAESPKPQPPAGKMVDQRVWFLLGRLVYEVWNSLSQVSDSLGSLDGDHKMPQLRNISKNITEMTTAIQKFIQEAPWPEHLLEPWEDSHEIFQA
jgi:CheY-like chemotaxis protein|uniref:Response regulator n=1 Tax=Desulfobacca acetoxidans TaxID=60893 RepID=A0A7V6A3C3_9BACT